MKNKNTGSDIDVVKVSERAKRLISEGALLSAAYYLYRFGADVKDDIAILVKMEESARSNIIDGAELNVLEEFETFNDIASRFIDIANELRLK